MHRFGSPPCCFGKTTRKETFGNIDTVSVTTGPEEIQYQEVRVYEWLTLTCIQTGNGRSEQLCRLCHSVATCPTASLLCDLRSVRCNEGTQSGPRSRAVYIWDCQALAQDSHIIVPMQSLGTISESTKLVFGAFGARNVLCSFNSGLPPWSSIHQAKIIHRMRNTQSHLTQCSTFSSPRTGSARSTSPSLTLRKSGEVFIIKPGELAVIRRGLEVTREGASFNLRRTSTQGQREGGLPHRPAVP